MILNTKDRLVYALDQTNYSDALQAIADVGPHVGWIKVNSLVFESDVSVKTLVHSIRDRCDARIFLDMKWHDIPTTVARNADWASRSGIDMFTIHTSGGREMMNAASNAVSASIGNPNNTDSIILGVTTLTSLDDDDIIDIDPQTIANREDRVRWLANMAADAKLGGAVASAKEASLIREQESCNDLLIVTPGIRLAENITSSDDQKNIGTPYGAIYSGADILVMGRDLINGSVNAVNQTLGQIERGLEKRNG